MLVKSFIKTGFFGTALSLKEFISLDEPEALHLIAEVEKDFEDIVSD